MEGFAKYSAIDWFIMIQVILLWTYMFCKANQWLWDLALRKGWRWWKRNDEKLLAMETFHEAFNLESIKPGQTLIVTAESGLTVFISRPKEKE